MSMKSAREMLVELNQAGLSDHQIADETKISQPTVTRIRNGDHADPRYATWAAIQKLHEERIPPRTGTESRA